ncbi:MAG TPA: DinB family protein [Thermoanaerobaculia bacterium]
MAEAFHPEQQRALEYLARKGTHAPLDVLRSQVRAAFDTIERLFDDVAPEEWDRSPAAGKWSPHQILDHLVLSHGPAIAQLESLLAGVTPDGVAIPAGLQSAANELREWIALRDRLDAIHRELLRLIDSASDGISLEPKAVVEMVVKVDGKPRHWYEFLDWKAFVQGIRVHTLEHRDQLRRTLNRPE